MIILNRPATYHFEDPFRYFERFITLSHREHSLVNSYHATAHTVRKWLHLAGDRAEIIAPSVWGMATYGSSVNCSVRPMVGLSINT